MMLHKRCVFLALLLCTTWHLAIKKVTMAKKFEKIENQPVFGDFWMGALALGALLRGGWGGAAPQGKRNSLFAGRLKFRRSKVGKPQMGPGQKGPGKPIFSAEIIENIAKQPKIVDKSYQN